MTLSTDSTPAAQIVPLPIPMMVSMVSSPVKRKMMENRMTRITMVMPEYLHTSKYGIVE